MEQWTIDWRPAADPAPLPANLRQAVKNWGQHERTEEAKAARDRPSDPHAPVSGWWWSFPQGLLRTVGHLPAGLNLVEDSLGWVEATAIPVRGAGRTLEIRTPEDWAELCQRFPLEVTASRRHDWFNTTGRNRRWVIPDWEQVAAQWDAVHLTVLSYLRGAGGPFLWTPTPPPSLRGGNPAARSGSRTWPGNGKGRGRPGAAPGKANRGPKCHKLTPRAPTAAW